MESDVGWRAWPARGVALAAVVLTAFAGGACGSGGSDEAKARGPAPTAAASPVEQDRATAMRMVLTPADVPNLPPAGPSGYNRLYARCGLNPLLPGGDDARQAPPAGFLKDETAELKMLQTTAVASYAVLAPNEEVARVVMATLRAPEFRTCLERELRSAVNADTGRPVVQTIATTDIAAPVLGSEVVAFRTTVSQQAVRQTLDLTTVRKGRALASVTTSRLGAAAFPDQERIRLVRLVAGRIG